VDRREEIGKLLEYSPEQLVKESQGRLIILENLDELHKHLARAIADEIKGNNKLDQETKLILPVGPTGQYPILVKIINEERISLKKCRFFFMDENCFDDGTAIPAGHPLSFKGEMQEFLFEHIPPELAIPEEQIIFPNHLNVENLSDMIADAGGIDTCYGGIGIHGHVAFNEPEKGVKNTGPRIVQLNAYTVTINAIRAEVGGDVVNFFTRAVTLGMKEILGAKRIRLYCRNDIPDIDWANTVCRLAALGTPGDDYPVTHIREHPDYRIITDKNTASKPKYNLYRLGHSPKI